MPNSWGTNRQRHTFGTGNILNIFDFRGISQFISVKQGNRYPSEKALYVFTCTKLPHYYDNISKVFILSFRKYACLQ